jgi:hypothetical protein
VSDGWDGDAATSGGVQGENARSVSHQSSKITSTIKEAQSQKPSAVPNVSKKRAQVDSFSRMKSNHSQLLSARVEPDSSDDIQMKRHGPIPYTTPHAGAFQLSSGRVDPPNQTSVNIADRRKKDRVSFTRHGADAFQLSSGQVAPPRQISRREPAHSSTPYRSLLLDAVRYKPCGQMIEILQSECLYPRNAGDVNDVLKEQQIYLRNEVGRLKALLPGDSKSLHRLHDVEAKYFVLKLFMKSISMIEKVNARCCQLNMFVIFAPFIIDFFGLIDH